MFKKTLTALAALALTVPAIAKAPPQLDEWTLVNTDEENSHYIRDKDWTAGRPDTRSITVWIWVDEHASRTLSHTLNQIEINCVAERYRMLSTHAYDVRGKSDSYSETGSWQSAPPSTIIEEIIRVTCMDVPEDYT